MNSPRAIAAQNCCTTSVTIRSENRAITRLRSPAQHGNLAGPGSRSDSAPIAAGASPSGLGYATTGALLNHRARMT